MTAVSQGMVFIHSAPKALRPHIEWAISRVMGKGITLSWSQQSVLPGTLRAEYAWQGPVGAASALASELRGWDQLRFEITEDASAGADGGRWCHTPSLGIFHSPTDAAGNMVITENRLRAVLEFAQNDAVLLAEGIQRSLGQAWDDELDVFRYASDVSAVRWLHQVS